MKAITEYITPKELDQIRTRKWTLLFGNHSLALEMNGRGLLRVSVKGSVIFTSEDSKEAIDCYASKEEWHSGGVRVVTTL